MVYSPTPPGRLVRRDNPQIAIAGTMEHMARITAIRHGRIDAKGRLQFERGGATTFPWNDPTSAIPHPMRIFFDTNGDEVPETNVALMLESGQLVLPFHPWRRHG